MKNVKILKGLESEEKYFVREELFDDDWLEERIEGDLRKSNLPVR